MKKVILSAVSFLLCFVILFGAVPSSRSETTEYTVSSITDLKECMYSASLQLLDDIVLHFTSRNMYETYISDSSLRTDLKKMFGICDAYEWHYTDPTLQTAGIKDIVFCPGTRILCAWEFLDDSMLTQREKQTLHAAEDLLEKMFYELDFEYDELGYEKWILRELRKRVTYDSTKSGDADTAVGALLDGKANDCGFADAFFLLCSMSRVSVCYMPVRSLSGSHGDWMMNQVMIDGKWYMVDATDRNSQIFNAGTNIAGRDFSWDDRLGDDLARYSLGE